VNKTVSSWREEDNKQFRLLAPRACQAAKQHVPGKEFLYASGQLWQPSYNI
jgi:hypothetical protein